MCFYGSKNKEGLFPYAEITGLVLSASAKLRRATITCVMSVRLFVRPHRTTRPPLDGF